MGNPVGVDGETLAATKAKCVAPPPVRDTFPVADDGLSTDVTVDEALRARARANRLLYIRAPESDEAFAKLVSDSFSLLEPLTQAVADSGKPLDPDQDVAQVAIPGAFAYALEGGLRASLAWKHLRAVAKPAARRLLAALEDFDRDYLGAWIEPLTDLGGCHKPAQAAQPLAKLVDAWLDAPVSAREAFRDYLAGQLRDMATNGCLCAPRSALDKLRGALEANAVLLERLPEEIGADPAQRLRALPTSPDTFFSCARASFVPHSVHAMTAEALRLEEDQARSRNWKRLGPYLAERQWGTVREDYSADGNCWDYFPHDHARSRAYRWGEDGLLGICDRQGRLCFALALWNGAIRS